MQRNGGTPRTTGKVKTMENEFNIHEALRSLCAAERLKKDSENSDEDWLDWDNRSQQLRDEIVGRYLALLYK